jgi:hypothetical protein
LHSILKVRRSIRSQRFAHGFVPTTQSATPVLLPKVSLKCANAL